MLLQARRKAIPVSGTFELTPLCNFKCRMCYVRLEPEEVSARGRLYAADEWLRIAQEAMEMGLFRVCLTGGEVLTRPDFADIYFELTNMGLLVSVLSNGSLVNKDVTSLFANHPPHRLRFTLYGASNSTYERLCQSPDGFDKTIASLKMLDDAGIDFDLAFTSTTENIDDLDSVKQVAESFGAPLIISRDLESSKRSDHCEADSLRIDERDITEKKPTEEELARAEKSRALLRRNPDLFSGLFGRCRAYRSTFCIDWNGDMECCPTMSYCHCRPFEEGFAAAWGEMHKVLGSLSLPAQCSECDVARFCTACPASRAAETGSLDGVPRRLCAEARKRAEGSSTYFCRS